MPGVCAAYTVPRISAVRSARWRGFSCQSRKRATSMPVTSTSGRPSATHWATTRPRPPADRMPTEFSPAHTK